LGSWTLAKPARQFACLGFHPIAETYTSGGLFNRRPCMHGRDAVRPRSVSETAAHGEIVVQAEEIRQVAKQRMNPSWLLARIEAGDRHAAGIRRLERSKTPQKRGFAGSVGSHERRDRLRRNAERSVLQGPLRRVFVNEIANLDHRAPDCASCAVRPLALR
jgi:hypothetical protein